MNLEKASLIFATAAHAAVGQRRKYTKEPYIVHPIEVASIVQTVDYTPYMVAAAHLHDTVEDTEVTSELIYATFGPEVGELVAWLTDVSKPEDGNRATRKEIDRMHSAAAPAAAQTVKVADLISNSRTIIQYDKDFSIIYIREKELLLDVLTKADPKLVAQAREIIRNYKETR